MAKYRTRRKIGKNSWHFVYILKFVHSLCLHSDVKIREKIRETLFTFELHKADPFNLPNFWKVKNKKKMFGPFGPDFLEPYKKQLLLFGYFH